MKKKQFKKQLMQNTILYLSILSISLFIITSYIYVKRIVMITTDANHNFLALMKTQTEHFLEHPISEILSMEEQLISDPDSVVLIDEDYHGYILRIEYLNENGIVERTFPNNDMRIGMDMGRDPYIDTLTLDEIKFSDTSIDHATSQVFMKAGKKLANGGYLIGYLNLNKLGSAFSAFETHGNLFTIVDNKGNYLLHPDSFAVASRSVDPNAADIQLDKIESGDLVKLSGDTYILEYIDIKNTGWHLLIYQDYMDFLFPILLSIALVLFSIIVVFILVSRSFDMSFSKFERGFLSFIKMTQKVAEGDYLAVQTNYEFVEFENLSHNFVSMIGEIETREEEIQKYNLELQDSRDELRASNDELNATLQQLIAIDKEHRAQNEYLDHQNSRLANLIEGTHAGTWEWDIPTGEVVINERWAEMLGYNLEDLCPLLMKDFYAMICPDDLEALKRELEEAFLGTIPFYEAKFRMKHKEGHWVWVNSIGKIIHRDEQFTPLLMSGIHMDITDSVNIALKIQERLYGIELIAEFTSKLLNNKSDRLFEIIGGLINKVCEVKNHQCWSFILFESVDSFDVLKQNTLFKVLLPDLPIQKIEKDYPYFHKQIKESESIHVMTIDDLPDSAQAEIKWFSDQNIGNLTLMPLHDGQEKIGCIAFESKDPIKEIDQEEINFFKILSNTVSEAIKKDGYEKGLIASKELANAANVAKGQFLANMSHEIRTPLNGISGYLHLMTESDTQDNIKSYGETAIKITEGMVRLVDDILDFSRIEAGKLKRIDEKIDLRDKLSELIDVYQYEAHNKSVDLKLLITDRVPRTIISDDTRLKQIISNLVSNAVKFSANGKVTVRVDTLDNVDGNVQLIIEVIDTGIGISADQLNAIFEPFNQGDNSSTRKYGGTGLGLSIVKQMVELLSGKIKVESTHGIGTHFTVEIPLFKEQISSEEDRNALQSVTSSEAFLKVLIVDDNEINQLVVRKVLELKGFTCDVASNGSEAVEAVTKGDYDCVFMDIQMPVMDGYDATRLIRALPDKEAVFIVAMTANAMSGDRERCIEAGMDEYVSKPLNYERMTEIVMRRQSMRK